MLLIAGPDAALQDDVDTWILREQDQGLIETLFAHWVMLSPGRPAGPPGLGCNGPGWERWGCRVAAARAGHG